MENQWSNCGGKCVWHTHTDSHTPCLVRDDYCLSWSMKIDPSFVIILLKLKDLGHTSVTDPTNPGVYGGNWTSVSLFLSLSLQYQGARDPGDEQASSESEEEEAHLCPRGQQTAPVAGGRGGCTQGQMQLCCSGEFLKACSNSPWDELSITMIKKERELKMRRCSLRMKTKRDRINLSPLGMRN